MDHAKGPGRIALVVAPLAIATLLLVVVVRTAACGDDPATAQQDSTAAGPAEGQDADPTPTSRWDPAGCPLAFPEDHAAAPQVEGDVILVLKSRYKLGFYRGGQLVDLDGEERRACFDIALGFEPVGHKQRQGDGKTPEGWYWVSWKIPEGQTSFHKALYVNYPNADDARAGLDRGLISQATHDRIVAAAAKRSTVTDSALGGLIEIHGSGSSPKNWTLGCVALDNPDIDWLYDASTGGRTAILIVP